MLTSISSTRGSKSPRQILFTMECWYGGTSSIGLAFLWLYFSDFLRLSGLVQIYYFI